MSIELHIERLVIDEAVLGGQGPGLMRAAIERELTKRLAQPGTGAVLADLGHVASVPTSNLPAGTPSTLGHRLAQTLARTMGVPISRRSWP